jgi:hypothetical protein
LAGCAATTPPALIASATEPQLVSPESVSAVFLNHRLKLDLVLSEKNISGIDVRWRGRRYRLPISGINNIDLSAAVAHSADSRDVYLYILGWRYEPDGDTPETVQFDARVVDGKASIEILDADER